MKIIGASATRDAVLEVDVDGPLIARVQESPSRAEAAALPILSPGFVDAQVNGYARHDVNSGDVEPATIVAITDELAEVGVTTWVPTVITGSHERIAHALDVVRRARASSSRIADAIPCAHVEGPFISADDGARGVHDRQFIRPIDATEVAAWRAAGPLGVITISGDGAHAPEHIRRIRALNITVALGHTAADHHTLVRAIDAGATLATHLGNGIPTMLPRHPNPIWTLLADDRVRVGLIADGHHLPAETLTAMVRAKGTHGAYLVSDLTELGGAHPGRYTTSVGGTVELGTDLRLAHVGSELLAGAAATLLDGVRFIAHHTPLGVDEALRLATASPALATPGTRPHLGRLQPGAPADLVLLDANTLIPQRVLVAGRWV